MNTSMTINGTAMSLLALYVGLARERGVPQAQLRGTTQNGIVRSTRRAARTLCRKSTADSQFLKAYGRAVCHHTERNIITFSMKSITSRTLRATNP
jgi:methylmalonyl-CoA mutase N-terminal domain/subunit